MSFETMLSDRFELQGRELFNTGVSNRDIEILMSKLHRAVKKVVSESSFRFHLQEKESSFTEIIDDLVTPLTSLETLIDQQSQEHLQKSISLIREGKRMIFVANHISELDPVLFDMWLRKNGHEDISNTMHTVIGKKVRDDILKRIISKGINTAHSYQKKVIDTSLDEEEKQKMNQHNQDMLKKLKEKVNDENIPVWFHPNGGTEGESISESWDYQNSLGLLYNIKPEYFTPIYIHGSNKHATSSDSYIKRAEPKMFVGDPELITLNRELVSSMHEKVRNLFLFENIDS